MCDRSSVLVFFLILKVLILVVLPIGSFILYKKESKIFNIVIGINISLLVLFIMLRIFNNNCIANSNISDIKFNLIKDDTNQLYELLDPYDTSRVNIEPDFSYKTYKNKNLYYYNQNRDIIKDLYYECNGEKIYANTYASSISALSMVISTLYNNNISPIEISNNFRENTSVCNIQFTIENIYESIKEKYNGLRLIEIDKSQVERGIRNGGLVIVTISSNENSNLTCDWNNIVIYNMNLEGKFMIADSTLTNKDFICPYSSNAYGKVIKSDRMNKAWSLDEIDNEAIHYYYVYAG